MSTQLQTIPVLTPGSNVNSYIQTVSSFDMLTLEREQELGRRLVLEDDLNAARELVLAHLRFVVHIAKSYNGYGLNLSDLIQEGNVGLMKAVKRFDPNKGVRLVSFAVHWIKAEIHEYILRNWRIVKIATTKAQRKLFFNLRAAKKHLNWLSNDEANAIANDLGVEVKDVRLMEGRLASPDQGFDAPANDDSDETINHTPALYLQDEKSDTEANIEKTEFLNLQIGELRSALKSLDQRSLEIIQARWLNDEDKITLHQLAEKYNVSAERIRQLEKTALKKLKKAIVA